MKDIILNLKYKNYIFFCKDLYIINVLKSNIIKILSIKKKIINKFILNDIEDCNDLYLNIRSNNIFDIKKIYIITIDKKEIFLFLLKYIKEYKNCILLIICIFFIKNLLFLKKNKLFIIKNYIINNYKTFTNFLIKYNYISLKDNKNKYLNLNILKWLYYLYNNNINIIIILINIFIKKKNIIKNILKNDLIIIDIYNFCYIYSLIIFNYKLFIISLLIIKKNFYSKSYEFLIIISNFLESIIYIKLGINKNIYYINNINNKFDKNDIIFFLKNINYNNLLNILIIIKNIEYNRIMNNNFENEIIWNSLEKLSYVLCLKK
ncbi:hypothetical protein NAREPO1_00680 [endosymbiont of Euscepes postfasciatus]|uniref:hypothetical protein n=1 Tax=endosymbiont of Euscepes postfasciatus TaxID=650377 RepID=UPI000DC71FDF|nr:hypothetical protein [endosymbiont of Euscepes postfasciatus]BBA84598.1 hypothetical protein NAREPO1_00680 [endosymbiont of Euscepes postfasciatus]